MAQRGAVWKAVVIVAAFMAAGFLMPVKRSSFTLFEYWVGSIVLFSLAAAGSPPTCFAFRQSLAVRIVFVAVTLMALIMTWLVWAPAAIRRAGELTCDKRLTAIRRRDHRRGSPRRGSPDNCRCMSKFGSPCASNWGLLSMTWSIYRPCSRSVATIIAAVVAVVACGVVARRVLVGNALDGERADYPAPATTGDIVSVLIVPAGVRVERIAAAVMIAANIGNTPEHPCDTHIFASGIVSPCAVEDAGTAGNLVYQLRLS